MKRAKAGCDKQVGTYFPWERLQSRKGRYIPKTCVAWNAASRTSPLLLGGMTAQTHKGHPKVAFVEASISQPKLTS
ncbi:hypothetical protein PSCICN_21930 [Pseudomonas cichorii]|nr:hypothetical protein PSCICN_21930 [Pseudomonas cichorii]